VGFSPRGHPLAVDARVVAALLVLAILIAGPVADFEPVPAAQGRA
jgi:hypothetical protein